MWQSILFVFLGGGVGSVLRYYIQSLLPITHFPYGTLLVNAVGGLLIGIAAAIITQQSHGILWTLLVIGFCGGFTTFSSFTLDAMRLLQTGAYLSFTLYILMTLTTALAATIIGFSSTKALL